MTTRLLHGLDFLQFLLCCEFCFKLFSSWNIPWKKLWLAVSLRLLSWLLQSYEISLRRGCFFRYCNDHTEFAFDIGMGCLYIADYSLPFTLEQRVSDSLHRHPLEPQFLLDYLRSAVKDYLSAVRNMACEVLELMEEGLKIQQKNVFTKLLMDEQSDSAFRLYPPVPETPELYGGYVIGFGLRRTYCPANHTILRSNNTYRLQIASKDGNFEIRLLSLSMLVTPCRCRNMRNSLGVVYFMFYE